MKENKITIRFSDDELEQIKKVANDKGLKVATLIRNITLNSIFNESLLSNEEELRNFIIKVVNKSNDKKYGRIISLLFRATSHIDIVKEQNDIFYNNLKAIENIRLLNTSSPKHCITEVAEVRINARDKQNIINKKNSINFEINDDF